MHAGWCLALCLALAAAATPPPAPRQPRVFACGDVFRSDTTSRTLADAFGPQAVRTADVHVGEGEFAKGSVLFGGSPDEVDIVWADERHLQFPRGVFVRREGSNWAAAGGITIGTSLRTLEQLNGRPFTLAGFGWDYEGTVVSWNGGRLDRPDAGGCRLRLRLRPARAWWDGPEWNAVQGDRDVPSSHPAMQRMDPQVYEMWLDFARIRAPR